MQHPHYELIHAYYANPDRYDLLVQLDTGGWMKVGKYKAWNPDKVYRLVIKERTLIPTPYPRALVTAPDNETTYYVPLITGNYKQMSTALTWKGDPTDYQFLARGLVHLSKKNAIAHAQALILASGGTPPTEDNDGGNSDEPR